MGVIFARSGGGGTPSIDLFDDFSKFGKDLAVIPFVPTVICSLTVPLLDSIILQSLVVGGNDNAEFWLSLNGTEEIRIRNAWTDRTKEHFLGSRKVASNILVEVWCLNKGDMPAAFEARINCKLNSYSGGGGGGGSVFAPWEVFTVDNSILLTEQITLTQAAMVDSEFVLINGMLQTPGIDYTILGATITFTSGVLTLGDTVSIRYIPN